jgi:hypothetical protein
MRDGLLVPRLVTIQVFARGNHIARIYGDTVRQEGQIIGLDFLRGQNLISDHVCWDSRGIEGADSLDMRMEALIIYRPVVIATITLFLCQMAILGAP